MYKYNGLKYNFSFTFTKKDKVVTPMLAWGKAYKKCSRSRKGAKIIFYTIYITQIFMQRLLTSF